MSCDATQSPNARTLGQRMDNSLTSCVAEDLHESNKRRKTVIEEEKVPVPFTDPAVGEKKGPVPSTDPAVGEEKEKMISLRRRIQKFYFDVDLPSSDDEDVDAYHGINLSTISDSDDDEWLEMENGVRHMNKAELAKYYKQIEESKGFDIDIELFNKRFVYDGPVPIHRDYVEKNPEYMELAKAAVRLHNEKKMVENFELLDIITVNAQYCGDHDYYFTLKLKDKSGCEKIYRAKLQQDWGTEELSLLLFEEVVSNQKGSSSTDFSSCCPSKNVDIN